MFLVRCIHNRSTANFCHLFAVAVKAPAADFRGAYDIFDKQHSSAEPQRQLVKQLYVLQQVVV